MRILLVEDDQLLGEGIKSALAHFSYSVDWLREGRLVVSTVSETDYALLILDLGLPDVDGVHILESIRRKKIDIPILVLTARDQIDNKLTGLNAGADDYMVKPFDVRELEARIRSLTRRNSGRRSELIELGKAALNIGKRVLIFKGESIEFSRREFNLVHAFFEHPDRVYTRESLETLSYGWDEEVESNALEVHIHRLRKKLGGGAIKTVRGVGYRLEVSHFS